MESSEGLAKRSADTKNNLAAPEAENKYHGKPPLKQQQQQQQRGFRSLAIAVSLPLLLGVSTGLCFSPDKQWYASLEKPFWNPPGWAFSLVWSIVYPLMGLSSWLVWAKGGWHKQAYPLGLYVLQLALNLFWSVAFFGLQNPLLALVDVVLLTVVILACIRAFKPANHVASNLMQIYLTWSLFAAVLNASIWYLNLAGGSSSSSSSVVGGSPREPHLHGE